MNAESLAFQFQLGRFVFDRNLEGIQHEESLRVPEGGANSLNWILGHIVRTRNEALRLLGAPSLFPPEDFQAYGAIPGPFPPLNLDALMDRFHVLGEALTIRLKQTSPDAFKQAAPFSPSGNPNETIGSLLVSIGFHEAYHLGQIGILRRQLGHAGALQAPGQSGH
jgi:uncharacterized damage-inducible protein DinB